MSDLGNARQVRIISLPLDVQARAQEQHAELMREFALLGMVGSTETADVPRRLTNLMAELSERYADVGGSSEADCAAAVARGETSIDLIFDTPVAAGPACDHLVDLLDEADAFCREGDRLLTLAAGPELVAFRHWYLGEFARQLRGEPPTSWADYIRLHPFSESAAS